MTIKILSCFHKGYITPDNDLYLPIHVGKASSNFELGFVGDDTCDNISIKNNNYCELTALYWAWKNIKCDYIGLCHYRRYFDFSNGLIKYIDETEIAIKDFNHYVNNDLQENIYKIFNEGYDIILPKRKVLGISLYEDYCKYHIKSDFDIMIAVILEKYPDYKNSINKVLYNNKAHNCNMFIMKNEEFNKYCNWLFDILFEVEKRIEISADSYQARVFGFMAERLINIYAEKNNLKIKEQPLIFIVENTSQKVTPLRVIRHKVGKLKRNIVFKVTKKKIK